VTLCLEGFGRMIQKQQLSLVAGFFASGYSPPGPCGDVLRHNQARDIDASPLFYSEVENMTELERGVMLLRRQAQAGGPSVPELRGDSY
jgi:hypothetical protein